MLSEEPETFDEMNKLVNSGALEIMLVDSFKKGTVSFLVCDNRRSYAEGEIYQLDFPWDDCMENKEEKND